MVSYIYVLLVRILTLFFFSSFLSLVCYVPFVLFCLYKLWVLYCSIYLVPLPQWTIIFEWNRQTILAFLMWYTLRSMLIDVMKCLISVHNHGLNSRLTYLYLKRKYPCQGFLIDWYNLFNIYIKQHLSDLVLKVSPLVSSSFSSCVVQHLYNETNFNNAIKKK
jgi:hypothetical protein